MEYKERERERETWKTKRKRRKTGERNLRDRRRRDTAGRAVNYKRSAKPLWSSLGGAGVSRRIDNTEFVRGRRNLDGPWFIQPPEPASQPASQPANQARLDTSTMLRFSRLPLTLSSSLHPVYYLCPILVAGTPVTTYIHCHGLRRTRPSASTPIDRKSVV